MTEHFSAQTIETQLITLTTQLLIDTGIPHKHKIQLTDSIQRQLSIDSLGRAELFHRIEKHFKLTIPDVLLGEVETLQDIAQYLAAAKPTLSLNVPSAITHAHHTTDILDMAHAQSLVEVLCAYAERAPQKPHIYFQQEEGGESIITYGELFQMASRVAHHLRDLGLNAGETVAIMQPTHPEFFYTFFGTLLAGGIPVPIYPPFRMHMLEAYAKTEAHILKNAETRFLITFKQAEQLSHLLKTFVPSLKHVMTPKQLLQPLATQNQIIDTYPLALIQYTSGSTSNPKGVLLSHQNLLTNIRAYGKTVRITPQDVAVSWLPLYHDMGLIGMWLGSLYYGIPLVLMTPFAFLNHPERWLWMIHYHRGTLSGAPNFAYELCVRKIDPEMIAELDLSSWRIAANGAEQIHPNTLMAFNKKFAPFGLKPTTLRPVYGLAESTVALTISSIDQLFEVDYVDRKQFEENQYACSIAPSKQALTFVNCGHPIEGHDIRIVDNNNQVLAERHVGQLQFRGPSNMQGYYHRPDATAAVCHNGWIDSGDIAYLQAGNLYVVGRRKDVIIKTGRNLYPAEIETTVGQTPGIRQGCVIAFGLSDETRGTEQLIVVAETREKNKARREAMLATINTALSDTLDIIPDHIVLVAPHIIPKTSSGKLQRAQCKKLYLENKLRKWPMPAWLQIVKLGIGMVYRQSLLALSVLGKLFYNLYLVSLLLFTFVSLYPIVLLLSKKYTFRFAQYAARGLIFLAGWRLTLIHTERLKQKKSVIYVANHASYIDALIVFSILPPHTRLVGKKELLHIPILRTLMRKLEIIPVDRLDSLQGLEDFKNIMHVFKMGHSVLMFPEGTFGYAIGLRPFRLGAFKIAADTASPVCPIALAGTRHILRDGSKLLRPGSITITVSHAITAHNAEWQTVVQLRDTVRAEIAKHCGEPILEFINTQPVDAATAESLRQ